MSLENLALDIAQQSSFDASLKNICTTLKDGDENFLEKNKNAGRGVVFLNRIPFGFFEDEIRKYFSQFGYVTRVRVARSRKTGNSKGFAYVEFRYPEVAKVAAETMDNYLMFNKIMQAKYIPPEEQIYDYFHGVVKGKVPRDRNRKLHVARYNRLLSKEERRRFCERASHDFKFKMKKLQKLGIEYECKPVIKYKWNKPPKAVLTIDESDEEITFKIPQNVTIVRKKATSIGKKKISSKGKKLIEISEEDNSATASLGMAKNSALCSKTQKDENKDRKKIRADSQHNDGHKSNLKIKNKNDLESMASKRKSNFIESVCEELTEPVHTPKLKSVKTVRSVSSVWKVDDCS